MFLVEGFELQELTLESAGTEILATQRKSALRAVTKVAL